jgi:hypothetical protein
MSLGLVREDIEMLELAKDIIEKNLVYNQDSCEPMKFGDCGSTCYGSCSGTCWTDCIGSCKGSSN